ncbi:MAG: hypothetical protein LBG58_10755 [Planctomycetaceae bacterium]|nr:hypothetical protein [Planctomycetaceae bacterium]
MVGNLSPKGCAGWFIIRVVRCWFLISICKQGQVGYRRRDLSAKGRLPQNRVSKGRLQRLGLLFELYAVGF